MPSLLQLTQPDRTMLPLQLVIAAKLSSGVIGHVHFSLFSRVLMENAAP